MDELRIAVATALASIDDYVFAELPADEGLNYLITDQQRYLRMADVFVAEIEAAGYRIVDAGRLERLQAECREILGGIAPEGAMYLQPGDLEGTS